MRSHGRCFVGVLCEIPRSACPSRPGGGGGVPLGSHVLGLTRGEGRGGRALKRMHRSKNSVKERCVAASAKVTSLGLPLSLVDCASLRSSRN